MYEKYFYYVVIIILRYMNNLKKKLYSKILEMAYWSDSKKKKEIFDGYGYYYIRLMNKRGAHYFKDSLTREEKKAVKKVWGTAGKKSSSFSFYKQYCGYFSPYFVPDDYYRFAEDVLNMRWGASFLQHKCNLKYFIPKTNRAEVIIQKIDGHICCEDNTEVSMQDAVSRLKQKSTFVYKIARGTGGGKSVRKVDLDEVEDKDMFLEKLLSPEDIEIENLVYQSSWMAQFNQDSVNTIRMLTLNINGRCTVLSSFLRMGAKGSFVDNLSGGHGVLVGVNDEGFLNEFGINRGMERKTESPTGVVFDKKCIPDFELIKKQIVDYHTKIPYANLIGWDVALDENNNPIILEINLDSALVEAHQIFNGPIFGERLLEVQDYIERRKPSLKHRIIVY